jgi:pimeloyl-ACP methyl ester carboxylesterase
MLRISLLKTACLFCWCISTYSFAQREFDLFDEVFLEDRVFYQEADTIAFLRNKTRYSNEKPTIVYLTGSLPKPLIIEFEDGYQMMAPFNYFDVKQLVDHYNLVVVSRPFTPLHAFETDLVNYLYVPDKSNPNCFDLNYLRCDNLEYLGERTAFLIDQLVELEQISPDRIILMGHSQGGREAPRVAALNNKISDVIVLNCGAYGRMQHVLVDLMRDVVRGEVSFEHYLERRTAALEYLQLAIATPNELSCERGSHKNVLSFATHMLNDILQTKANIYYASGSHDVSALHADQLLIDCWMENKTNITTKVFPNSEHSFIHVNSDGSLNYETMYWDKVITDALDWLGR